MQIHMTGAYHDASWTFLNLDETDDGNGRDLNSMLIQFLVGRLRSLRKMLSSPDRCLSIIGLISKN